MPIVAFLLLIVGGLPYYSRLYWNLNIRTIKCLYYEVHWCCSYFYAVFPGEFCFLVNCVVLEHKFYKTVCFVDVLIGYAIVDRQMSPWCCCNTPIGVVETSDLVFLIWYCFALLFDGCFLFFYGAALNHFEDDQHYDYA